MAESQLNPPEGMGAAPSEFDMPYSVDALGKPALAYPGQKLTGRKFQNAVGSANAANAAAYQASQAQAEAKNTAMRAQEARHRGKGGR